MLAEEEIRRWKGIIYVAVSGTGFIQFEYMKQDASEDTVVEQIKKRGLAINKVANFPYQRNFTTCS
ncbi:MAG: hypothetical protein ABI707_17515 [Ferruginibacter sp.]